MTNKYLVTIEFRYNKVEHREHYSNNVNKTITIGVFDSFEDACNEGNKNLEVLEGKFELNKNWNTKQRFSKNGGCFNSKKTLITNLTYLKTPFEFYAQIIELRYENINNVIEEVTSSVKEYQNSKK